jgi:hypothetical protein
LVILAVIAIIALVALRLLVAAQQEWSFTSKVIVDSEAA